MISSKSTCTFQDGAVFFSIDGNFGLCRKKAAGNSVRPPLHEKAVFFDQESVDKYVASYGVIQMSTSKVSTIIVCVQVCNNKVVYLRNATNF